MQALTRREGIILEDKIMKNVNDDELVLNPSRVVLEVNNKMSENFYKAKRYIVKENINVVSTYSTKFKIQCNDSKNKVMYGL